MTLEACCIVGGGMEKVNTTLMRSPAAAPPPPPPLTGAESAHTYPRSTFGCTDGSPLLRSSFRECDWSVDRSFATPSRRNGTAQQRAPRPPPRPSSSVFVRRTARRTPSSSSRYQPFKKTFLSPPSERQRGLNKKKKIGQ